MTDDGRDVAALAGSATGTLAKDLAAITEIPAPTFKEGARARWLARRWREAGAPSVTIDAVGNVRARLPGRAGDRLYVLAAHLDTVFAADVPISVRRRGQRLLGPGSGDNGAGLAVVTSLIQLLADQGLPRQADLLVVGTVGEEGLGNLRGARHLVQELGPELSGFVAVDGMLGSLVLHGVGSQRYRLTIRGEGGHSWADGHHANPVRALAAIVRGIYDLERPPEPRSTVNVSGVRAPGSINTIPASAEALLEVRSADAALLASLAEQLEAVVAVQGGSGTLRVELEEAGRRPAGATPPDQPFAAALLAACAAQGLEPHLEAASTDANAAMAAGVPAAGLGIRRGGGAHTLDEFVELPSLVEGLALLYRAVLQLDRAGELAATLEAPRGTGAGRRPGERRHGD